MTNALLRAALSYSARGLACVPIRANSKQPIVRNWQNSRLSLADLEYWFTGPVQQQAVTGLGVVCGQLSDGLVILDFDGQDWAEAYEHFTYCWPELDQNPQVITGSGKRHVWLKCPDLNGLTRETYTRGLATIEVRANKHQCLTPPSQHPQTGLYYRWADTEAELTSLAISAIQEWLCSWADVPPKAPQPQTLGFDDIPAYNLNGRHPLPQQALAFLALTGAQPQGQRNQLLYSTAQQLGAARYSLNEALDMLGPVANRIGLDQVEISSTIKSGWSAAAGKFEPSYTSYSHKVSLFTGSKGQPMP